MNKYKQDEKVYFRIKEGGPEGWAYIAGDYDLFVILKPEIPLNSYSHIYVVRTQIVEPTVNAETEKDIQTGPVPTPADQETFQKI